MTDAPLAVDICCGLGGWTEGLLAEGYRVVGVDIEEHVYGEHRYPADLMVRDVLTIHGSLFRDAALIVASPPCQAYSYMAMPWSRGKAKAAAIRADTTGAALEELNRLFNACFRIQREACEAAGRYIPMVVENVRGAEPWVGRARWSFGSFYLWGDVPALMPHVSRAQKFNPDGTNHGQGSWFAIADSKNRGARKVPGFRFDGSGRSFQTASVEGTKQGGDWFAEARKGGAGGTSASFGSKSPARKMASAMIAKIPLALSRHIAAVYAPRSEAA